MPSKCGSRVSRSVSLALGTANGKCCIDAELVVYTVGTFLLVLAIYVVTRGWKGYSAPEEVDLGSVQVPLDQTPTNIIHYYWT